jgi:MoaA/NifB/PqqE/SkfB family radical SAM enzyme
MKAKYEPRIDLVNRTKLEKVIPLDTPLVVFVDPSDACNFKCRFCPTSDRDLMKAVGRPWKQLSFDLFTKIADDMLAFPNKVEVLRLYKDGEPLLNKRLVDMIKYAKDIGASNRIDTTTNASLLNKEKGRAIANAGLDRINISVYGVLRCLMIIGRSKICTICRALNYPPNLNGSGRHVVEEPL